MTVSIKELIESTHEKAVALGHQVTKQQVKGVIDSMMISTVEAVKEGKVVTLPAIGKIAAVVREERTGRNPKTGESITIPASRNPKLRVSKNFRDFLNQ